MINQIRRFSTVGIKYSIREKDGSIFESNENPIFFQIGNNQIMRSIEDSIIGMRPGDRTSIEVPVGTEFPERRGDLVTAVHLSDLPPGIKEGQVLFQDVNGGRIQSRVASIGEEFAILDNNHPLAGKDVTIDVEITDVLVKKKCAVFTIVKNEPYFLDIWLRHYKRFFDNDDIYVVDHQSDDGSTDGLDVNVKRIYNEVSCDWNWLVRQAEEFQEALLHRYDCVIYCDTDEMIYSHERDLKEVIEDFLNSDMSTIKCVGYEIIQDLEKESPLKEGDSIIKNRNYWFRRSWYDKTLISKVPLKWHAGFHTCHNIPETNQLHSYGVTLCHLHRSDFERMVKKHQRTKDWKNKTWTVTQRDEALDFFNTVRDEAGFEITEIPEKHKIALHNI
jgi:FKBP-type peptidyl-prolyl cis-trans isomerase 2